MSEQLAPYNRNGLTNEQKTLIRNIIAPKANDDELALFFELCKNTGLDPFKKQVYLLPFWNGELKRFVFSAITSIDGLRSLAETTGEYDGQSEPIWIDKDGKEYKVWISENYPFACKISVFKKGVKNPTVGVAYFDMFAKEKDGKYTGFWNKPTKAAHMIAKCAEALALRKAFPSKLSGLYVHEEMENNVKQKSIYEDNTDEKTAEKIREYYTDAETVQEIKESKNDFVKIAAEQKLLPQDQTTANKIVSSVQWTLHENSKEIDKMVQDLLNYEGRFSPYVSDEEMDKFVKQYNEGKYTRAKLLTLYKELTRREDEALAGVL